MDFFLPLLGTYLTFFATLALGLSPFFSRMGLKLCFLYPSLLGALAFVVSARTWLLFGWHLETVPPAVLEAFWALDQTPFQWLLLLPGLGFPPRSIVKSFAAYLFGGSNSRSEPYPAGPSSNGLMREFMTLSLLAGLDFFPTSSLQHDLPCVVLGITASYVWALIFRVHWVAYFFCVAAALLARALAWLFLDPSRSELAPSWAQQSAMRDAGTSSKLVIWAAATDITSGASRAVSWVGRLISGSLPWALGFGLACSVRVFGGQHFRQVQQAGREQQQMQAAGQWLQAQAAEQQRQQQQQQHDAEVASKRSAEEARCSLGKLAPTDCKPSDQALPNEHAMCVACWSQPRTVGLKHNTSVHLCLCSDCFKHAGIKIGSPCIICRQRVEAVMDVYT